MAAIGKLERGRHATWVRIDVEVPEEVAEAVRSAGGALDPAARRVLAPALRHAVDSARYTLVAVPDIAVAGERAAALLPALTELLDDADDAEVSRITSALSGSDDLDVSMCGPAPTPAEALAAVVADLRDQYAHRRALVETGLTCTQAAEQLGIARQAVTTKIEEHKLIGLRQGREWRLPAWQFAADTDTGYVPGLDRLQQVFPGGPVSLSVWMTRPSGEFNGRTPLQELLTHGSERVIAHAKRLTTAAW